MYNIIIDPSVVSQGHDREVVDGLSYTHKYFLSILMTIVKLTGVSENETHMVIHDSTLSTDISIIGNFINIFWPHHINFFLVYQGKYRKQASQRKWTERENHVQNSKYA